MIEGAFEPVPAGADVTPASARDPDDEPVELEPLAAYAAEDSDSEPTDGKQLDSLAAFVSAEEHHPVIQRLLETLPEDADRLSTAAVPRFRLDVNGLQAATLQDDARRRSAQLDKLRTTFTPSHPKTAPETFSGRESQLSQIVTAIEEDRAHVVVFGTRGLGKSSISNVTAEMATKAGYRVIRYSCSSETTFDEMFRNIFARIPGEILDHDGRAGANADTAKNLLPSGPLGATQVAELMARIRYGHALIVLDEFDRVRSSEVRNHLAETIKSVSDCLANTTFLILGVARDLDALLGHHPSIQRNLVSIHLPYMTAPEIDRLVLRGRDSAGILFDSFSRRLTVRLSGGLPYMAELICLHAGRAMLHRQGVFVSKQDMALGLRRIVDSMDPNVVDLYNYATGNRRNRQLLNTLFAAACTPFDAYGGFFAKTVGEILLGEATTERSAQKSGLLTTYNLLSRLAKDDSGAVLQRDAKAQTGAKYFFRDSLMRSYVMMRRIVDENLLAD